MVVFSINKEGKCGAQHIITKCHSPIKQMHVLRTAKYPNRRLNSLAHENEALENDVEHLEATLALHSVLQRKEQSSLRGMLRQETGTIWQHGAAGKLHAYKSTQDLGQNRGTDQGEATTGVRRKRATRSSKPAEATQKADTKDVTETCALSGGSNNSPGNKKANSDSSQEQQQKKRGRPSSPGIPVPVQGAGNRRMVRKGSQEKLTGGIGPSLSVVRDKHTGSDPHAGVNRTVNTTSQSTKVTESTSEDASALKDTKKQKIPMNNISSSDKKTADGKNVRNNSANTMKDFSSKGTSSTKARSGSVTPSDSDGEQLFDPAFEDKSYEDRVADMKDKVLKKVLSQTERETSRPKKDFIQRNRQNASATRQRTKTASGTAMGKLMDSTRVGSAVKSKEVKKLEDNRKTETVSKSLSEDKPKIEPKSSHESKSEQESKSLPQSKTEQKSKSLPQSKSELNSKSLAQNKNEHESKYLPQGKSELESESLPESNSRRGSKSSLEGKSQQASQSVAANKSHQVSKSMPDSKHEQEMKSLAERTEMQAKMKQSKVTKEIQRKELKPDVTCDPEVISLLESLQLKDTSQYVQLFGEHNFDMAKLKSATSEQLSAIGVTAKIVLDKLMQAIQKLQKEIDKNIPSGSLKRNEKSEEVHKTPASLRTKREEKNKTESKDNSTCAATSLKTSKGKPKDDRISNDKKIDAEMEGTDFEQIKSDLKGGASETDHSSNNRVSSGHRKSSLKGNKKQKVLNRGAKNHNSHSDPKSDEGSNPGNNVSPPGGKPDNQTLVSPSSGGSDADTSVAPPGGLSVGQKDSDIPDVGQKSSGNSSKKKHKSVRTRPISASTARPVSISKNKDKMRPVSASNPSKQKTAQEKHDHTLQTEEKSKSQEREVPQLAVSIQGSGRSGFKPPRVAASMQVSSRSTNIKPKHTAPARQSMMIPVKQLHLAGTFPGMDSDEDLEVAAPTEATDSAKPPIPTAKGEMKLPNPQELLQEVQNQVQSLHTDPGSEQNTKAMIEHLQQQLHQIQTSLNVPAAGEDDDDEPTPEGTQAQEVESDTADGKPMNKTIETRMTTNRKTGRGITTAEAKEFELALKGADSFKVPLQNATRVLTQQEGMTAGMSMQNRPGSASAAGKTQSASMTMSKTELLREIRKQKDQHRKQIRHLESELSRLKHKDPLKMCELSREDICFDATALLGEGAFSQVFHGFYQGAEVAVKRLKVPLAAQDRNYFEAEVSLLRELRHPRVVLLLGTCTTASLPLMVLEYMSGGSLYAYLHDPQWESLDHAAYYQIARDTALGMNYLHRHRPAVLHLDLKSMNVLLGPHLHAKIADFGFSKLRHEADVAASQSGKGGGGVKGTPGWMAPELLDAKQVTTKADVYSFAVILWEMLTKQHPYEGCSLFQIIERVRTNRRPEIPDNCPRPLQLLIKQSWDPNPAKRPSFKDLLISLENLSFPSEWRSVFTAAGLPREVLEDVQSARSIIDFITNTVDVHTPPHNLQGAPPMQHPIALQRPPVIGYHGDMNPERLDTQYDLASQPHIKSPRSRTLLDARKGGFSSRQSQAWSEDFEPAIANSGIQVPPPPPPPPMLPVDPLHTGKPPPPPPVLPPQVSFLDELAAGVHLKPRPEIQERVSSRDMGIRGQGSSTAEPGMNIRASMLVEQRHHLKSTLQPHPSQLKDLSQVEEEQLSSIAEILRKAVTERRVVMAQDDGSLEQSLGDSGWSVTDD